MAGFQKIYTSENEYLYDLGKSTGYFDEEYYDLAKKSGKEFEYLQMMASAKDNISSTFDPVLYDKLSGEERFNYFATENFMDKSSEDYSQAAKYYKQRQEQIQSQEIYDGLNGFQQAINSIGGWVGNTLLQLGGLVEGLVDVSVELTGALGIISEEQAKSTIAKDITGYGAAQAAMNEWINQYTFIDKNIVTKAINDVTSGIIRMTPMIVGSVLAPVTGGASAAIGTGIYYASMAGNTAEQAIQANPDINYGDLVLYTGATVGLEALTEWASAKLFGDDIISSMMKGQKYAPTGSIVKNIAKNFGTEALEEATSELFGSMLYNAMVDPTAEIASFEDILYAAVIGGLTGAVMSGGQVLTTKRMAVLDGKIVPVSSLSKEDLKRASKLGVAKSYGLNSLISQYQQGSQTTDEVTKLMAKYGTSVNNIAITHSAEYNEAIAKDTETKKQQAKIVLDLANMLRTIGVEQFTKSAEFLNQHLEQAQTLINNYLNRRSDYNASAAQAFNKAFINESFTPVAQPTNSEMELVNALRAAYPDKKVVFGTFGSKEGLATKSVRTTNEWIFIETGLVDKMGYKNVMQHAIRNELANNVLTELSKMNPSHVDALADLVSDNNKKYSDMTKAEKKALAQILCFDPINNKRLFFRNKEVHAKIFNYITEKANYVKRFGRRTEANKIRYHDLLTIRDMFLDNIANAIFNGEDVEFVAKKYNLTPEEVQLNIINKTTQTTLNDILKVTKLSFSKASILKREAIDELISNRADTTTDFDYNRIYDESYYNPVWVSQIKEQQKNQDFEQALKTHFELSLKTTLDDYNAFTNVLLNNVSPKDFKKLAKTILTQEYLDTNPSETAIMATVANKLWTMTDVVLDDSVDSIVITDNQIQGTGEIKFILGDINGRTSILSEEQQRRNRESAGEQIRPMAPSTAEYSGKILNKVVVNQQHDNTLDDNQTKLVKDYKSKYNLDLHFFKGRVEFKGQLLDNVNGFVDGNDVYLRYDGTLTDAEIDEVLEHEATHRLIAADKKGYKKLRKFIEEHAYVDEYQKLYNYYASDEMYGKIYDHDTDAIKEELIDDLMIGAVKVQYSQETEVNEEIQKFYDETKRIMSNKIDLGIKFSKKQPKLANQILKQFEDGAKNISETQFSESNSKEYSQVSYDMIDTMADTFALVNNDNYQEVRESLKKSDKKYAAQALEIFDLYTIEMVGKFNKEIQQKIENIYQKLQTEAGQRLALQAKRVATRKPISHTIATLERDGFKTTVTDELVQKYDAKLKDKDAYIKELEAQIKELEKQLKNVQNDIDKAALNKQLKEVSDKKGVIQNGSNADILDHIVTHTSSLEQAAKLQEDILEKLVATAIVAQEEGKKVGYYVYDDKGQLKPFPEASKKIAKTLKKLKSFRMWAMLSSPVTWVRNWLGNQGMRGLDSVTNFVEGFISSRTGFDERQMKFTESRAGKDLYQYIAEQNQAYIMSLVRGEDVKYETSTEKAADIKRRERAAQYESANAFKKACLKAQDMTDWGLSTGVFGDEPVVFQSICKNMGNLVANNIDSLLQGIQVEANALNKRASLTSAEQSRLDVLNKALQTKDAKDVFNALSKEETERLFDVCKERSFQQYFKNPNALSKWFAKFGTKHPVYAELVSWVMPFPKVAANVLSMAYRYSPLSFFKGLAELSKYKQMQRSDYKGPSTGFEKAQTIRTFSEASVGTFMLIAGAIFSAMGLIDIDEDDYMGPSIKIGDFKMSLSELAPSMTTFSTAAAVVWAWKNDKPGVTQALNVLYDNTLLGNVENLLTYGSFTDIGKNALISYTSQYIPAILKLINKGVTGGVKKDKSGNYLQRLAKTLGSYIPGVSELIPNKIDPYTGKKVYQAGAENWFLNLLASLSPVGIKWVTQSEAQRHATALGVETTGLSGDFKINDVEYSVSNKERYAKYRAEYIDTQFDKIITGKVKVTVEDDKGKRITTTYDKLTDKQKQNVINRLYTDATSMTKIKWWTDQGNTYVVTDRDLYNEYRKMFSNIVYKKNWSKSKFVES